MSENKVVDIILHCQKQIKKERLPEDKLLHYLGRLSRLRITVQDLAETGIGRTVNSLSRNEGQIGAAADTLVRRWKLMVSEQQNQAEQRRESEEESDSNSGSSEEEEEEEEDGNQPFEIHEQQVQANDNDEQQYSNNNHSSTNVDGRDSRDLPLPAHRKRDYEEDDDDPLTDDIEDPYMENGFLNMSNVHSDGDDDEEEDFEEGSENSDRLEIDDDEDHSHHRNDVKPDIYNLKRVKQVIDDKEHKSSSKGSSSNSNQHKPQENGDKKSISSTSPPSKSQQIYNHERSSEKSHSSSSKEHKHHHHLSSKESSSKERPSKHGGSGNGEQASSSSHQKSHQHHSSSKSDKSKESKSDHDKSSHHYKEKDKHNRSKEGTSSSHRDKEKDGKSEKDRSSKDQKIKESSDHHRSSSSSGSNKEKNKIRDTASSSSSFSPKKSSLESSVKKELSSSSSHAQEDRKRKEPSLDPPSISGSSVNKKSKLVLKEEIDSTSGINFADVLGSLDTSASGPSSTKHSSSKKEKKKEEFDKEYRKKYHESHHQSSSSSSKKHESSSSSKHSSSSSSKDAGSSSKKYDRDRDSSAGAYKPSKKLPLTQSKIESVIQPVVNISPNYKPMSSSLTKLARPGTSSGSNGSNGLAAPPPISITPTDLSELGSVDYWDKDNNGGGVSAFDAQEDAISTMLSSRNARSKVYSGVKSKSRGEVTSLYDLCMQVIKDNIGELGYTGGIPYDILKPALERANPQQLMSIESQNEYLIGETDELWQFHSRRDFRAKCPGETESWRELYERCTEEQKVKFEMIKKQMKRNIAKAEPVRTTKLAYVDSTLGPRFNKHKAQTIKNGMKTLKIKEEKGPSRGVSSSASAGFNNPKKSGDSNNVVVQEASVIIASESRAGHAPAPSVSREASVAKIKPKKAPLMQKTMKLIKSLHRR